MDATTLLSCAGELSALLVSGGLLLAASVAAKQSRKRSREEDELEPSAAREEGELSDGEEDSISVEWRQLRKLLKTNLQIDLVHRPDAGGDDDKYVRLNFAAKLPAKPSADDENRLIKALSEAGIKVLGSEDAGVLCVSKSDVGFMSSEEVLRRLNVALSAYQVASAAAALAAANAPVDAAAADDVDDDADEEESVVSSGGRRRRVAAPKKPPASAAKRRRTTGEQSAL